MCYSRFREMAFRKTKTKNCESVFSYLIPEFRPAGCVLVLLEVTHAGVYPSSVGPEAVGCHARQRPVTGLTLTLTHNHSLTSFHQDQFSRVKIDVATDNGDCSENTCGRLCDSKSTGFIKSETKDSSVQVIKTTHSAAAQQ